MSHVYPEAVWCTYADQQDIDEIVDFHLQNGRIVERLLLPAAVGRCEAERPLGG